MEWGKIKTHAVTVVIGLMIIYLTLAGLGFGTVRIGTGDTVIVLLNRFFGLFDDADTVVDSISADVLWYLRLPRFLLAAAAGTGLAVSGAVIQAVMKNPLADPYILGISSGAALGAAVAIMLNLAGILSPDAAGVFAFAGAMASSLLVLLLSSAGGKADSFKMLLSGLAMNAVCSALISCVVIVFDDKEGIQSITYWLMGSLARASWEYMGFILPVVLTGSLFFWSQSRILNLMLTGDDVSITLGRDLAVYRKVYVVVSAVMVGSIVYNSGMIGFVGLVIPHAVRLLTGTDHKILIPISALAGACFLVWADVLSRAVPGTEVPIGVVASMIGSPFFIYVLLRKNFGLGRQA